MRVVKHCNKLPREAVESLSFGNTQNSTEIQNSKYTRDSITLSANPNTVTDGLRRHPPPGCSVRSSQDPPLRSSRLHCLAEDGLRCLKKGILSNYRSALFSFSQEILFGFRRDVNCNKCNPISSSFSLCSLTI